MKFSRRRIIYAIGSLESQYKLTDQEPPPTITSEAIYREIMNVHYSSDIDKKELDALNKKLRSMERKGDLYMIEGDTPPGAIWNIKLTLARRERREWYLKIANLIFLIITAASTAIVAIPAIQSWFE